MCLEETDSLSCCVLKFADVHGGECVFVCVIGAPNDGFVELLCAKCHLKYVVLCTRW